VFWVEHLSIEPWLTKSYFKNSYIRISKKINGVVAVSKIVKEELIDMGIAQEKIKVIYNGVDLNDFRTLDFDLVENNKKRLGFYRESKIIGYVGRLHKEKGLDTLLDSFYQLAKRFDHLYLLIIGEGNERRGLEDRVKRMSLEKKSFIFRSHG